MSTLYTYYTYQHSTVVDGYINEDGIVDTMQKTVLF